MEKKSYFFETVTLVQLEVILVMVLCPVEEHAAAARADGGVGAVVAVLEQLNARRRGERHRVARVARVHVEAKDVQAHVRFLYLCTWDNLLIILNKKITHVSVSAGNRSWVLADQKNKRKEFSINSKNWI